MEIKYHPSRARFSKLYFHVFLQISKVYDNRTHFILKLNYSEIGASFILLWVISTWNVSSLKSHSTIIAYMIFHTYLWYKTTPLECYWLEAKGNRASIFFMWNTKMYVFMWPFVKLFHLFFLIIIPFSYWRCNQRGVGCWFKKTDFPERKQQHKKIVVKT